MRTYRDTDLGACRRLWEELTDWHRGLYASESIGGENPGLQFDAHLRDVGPENVYVADLDGEVIGMTGLIVRGSEVELEPLIVTKAARGTGLGTQLAEAVIARARAMGARTVVVKPAARNTRAVGFFHERGFDILGQIELMLDLVPGERAWHPADIATEQYRY